MNILIFGNVCIDHNTVEKESYEAAGSPAMFMTRVFKHFQDASVSIVAKYGEDFAKYIGGVKMIPSQPTSAKTLRYENIVPEKGRRIQKAKYRNESTPVVLLDEILESVSEADIIFFAPLLPNIPSDYIKDVFKSAKTEALKLLLPQGYFRNFDKTDTVMFRDFIEAKQILPFFDYIILSDEDYSDVEEISKEWVSGIPSKVIVTKGKDGASLISSKKYLQIPTREVKDIVDSTGSGDIFSASFAYKYFQLRDEMQSILFAHRIAGLCLAYTPEEIDDLELQTE